MSRTGRGYRLGGSWMDNRADRTPSTYVVKLRHEDLDKAARRRYLDDEEQGS